MSELRMALLQLAVGEVVPESLPEVATRALGAGVDTQALRELAGLRPVDARVARDLFVRAAHELGWEVPTEEAARWELVRQWASDILAGRLSPFDGARRIWWEGWEKLGRPDSLTPFVGLASEWEDSPDYREQYEQDILDEARNVVRDRWLEGELRVGLDLAAGMTAAERAHWGVRVLTTAVERLGDECAPEELRRLIAIAHAPARWAEAHEAFQALRQVTLRFERAGRDDACVALVLLAEVTAKTVYNGSGRPAPFDRDSYAWIAKNAATLADRVGDDALTAALWSALTDIAT